MAAGLAPDIELDEVTLDLAPGAALVFYTDGVTERRDGDTLFGEENVVATLARGAGRPAGELADRLRAVATDFGSEALRDDVAILVIRAT